MRQFGIVSAIAFGFSLACGAVGVSAATPRFGRSVPVL
jgi:hypothetical protein